MLVLSRKRNEGVVIGKDIEVIVLEVHGERVKLGFRTTDGVSIHREEVYQRIERDKCSKRATREANGVAELGPYVPRSAPNHSIRRRGQKW